MTIELLKNPDNFELIRDQLGFILKTEFANQKRLADADDSITDKAPYNVSVFIERSDPWNVKINKPFVNIRFISMHYIQKGSDQFKTQKFKATYHADCYTSATARSTGLGHEVADKRAIVSTHHTAKMVRNILSAGEYESLGFSKGLDFILKNWVQDIVKLHPTEGEVERQIESPVHATRVVYCLEISETSPQLTAMEIEGIDMVIHRESGEVLTRATFNRS